MKFLRHLFVLLLLLPTHSTPARALEKWFYYPANLLPEKNIDQLETIWRRASAAGYTHVLLADSKFSHLEEMAGPSFPAYFKNLARVKKIAAELKIEIVPALFSVGYSNDLLGHDPNLIEAIPVKKLPMIVQGSVARMDDPSAPQFPPDFSNPKQWSWKDDSLVPEDGALRVTDGGGGNARVVKKIKVQPWRQYHISVKIRTQDFHGKPEIKALVEGGADLQWNNLGAKPTQDWTVHHAVFNSREFTDVSIYFGVWGAGKGTLAWREPKIEEVAFVNMTRRPGTPLSVTTADGKPLVEGRDFEPLADPLLGAKPWKGEYDTWHEPPLLKTKLSDGTKLLVSYSHGATVYDHQAMICPSEPKTYTLLRDQAQRMVKAWGAKGYMMSHDEIRTLNWCDACQARHLTPGQIIADNVKQCIAILRAENPGGRIYTWSDMFDPNHNAVKGPYFLVNGPLTDSWAGLDKDVIILPWLFEKRDASLKWFADRGHKQVIAGYYDSDPAKVKDWIASAKKVNGSVIGVMYTTWENNYRDLEKFSQFIDGAEK
jgi:hypothetical protein